MWQEGWSPRCRADFLGLGPGQADGDRNRFRLRRVSGVQRPCLRTSFYARDRNRWGGRFKVSVWSVETPHIAVAQHHPLRIKPRLRIKMTWATSSAPGIGRASWTIFQEMQSGRRSLRHCCRQRCPFCRYTPGVWSRAAKPDICDGGDLGVALHNTQALPALQLVTWCWSLTEYRRFSLTRYIRCRLGLANGSKESRAKLSVKA